MPVKPAAMSIPTLLPDPPQEPDIEQQYEPPITTIPNALRPAGDQPIPPGVTDRREQPGPDQYGHGEGAGAVYEGEQPLRPEALFPDIPDGTTAHWYVHVVHHVTETVQRGAATHLERRFLVPADAPVQILGRDPNRRKGTILNLSTSAATVSLGREGNIVAAGIDTFPLAAGASLDIADLDQWFAIAEAVGVTILALKLSRDDEGEAGPGRTTYDTQ